MHTVWKGAISFGLVHVPVKLFTATESHDISMKMLHKDFHSPISYKRTTLESPDEVPWEDIIKGYEYEPGRYVMFDKDELQLLSDEASKEIKIVDFVDLVEIDPIYYQKTYYMAPGDTGANAYNLLKAALQESGKIGIANVTLRSKGSLAAIRVIDNCLSMVTMHYPAEIRPVSQVPNLPVNGEVNERELTMARMLIDQLSTQFEPTKFVDEYRKRLMNAISDKINGQQIVSAPEPQRANVVNLMEALQASLEQARATTIKDAAPTSTPTPSPSTTTRRKSRAKSGAGITGTE
ncbi:MAG: Ku protein [Paenibacillaceae bacterium]